jgi:hypothetical protein
MPAERPPRRWTGTDVAAIVGLIAVAAAFAGWMLTDYYRDPGDLWRNPDHDRNGHYLSAIDIAASMRVFDLVGTLTYLDKLRFYPPLYAMSLTPVLLLGGFDVRLAVLPALLGWTAAVALTGFIAFRLFGDRVPGAVAGAVAATFAIASPGFRALGADVMLEAPGAALTALALACYLHWRLDPDDARRLRNCAIALTLLFFLKGNYWLVTAVALTIAFAIEARASWVPFVRDAWRDAAAHAPFKGLAKDPLLLAAALVALAVLVISFTRPAPVTLFGQRVGLYPPGNLTTVLWALLFIRGAIAWRRNRAALEAWLPAPAKALFYWHLLPVAVYWLLPQRLSLLVGMVSPTNAPVTRTFNPWHGVEYYGSVLTGSLHAAPWSAWLALALALVAIAFVRRLAPGAIAVVLVLVLFACAVVIHPNTQGRYMASWIFSLWILAGAGAGLLTGLIVSRLSGALRWGAAAAAIGAVAVAHARAVPPARAVTHVSHFIGAPRDFDIAAAYADRVKDAAAVGVVSTSVGISTFIWPIRAACRCPKRIDHPRLPGADRGRENTMRAVLAWVGRTPAERVVVIDTLDRAVMPLLNWTADDIAGIHDAMNRQDRFKLVESVDVSSYPARVTIWHRR